MSYDFNNLPRELKVEILRQTRDLNIIAKFGEVSKTNYGISREALRQELVSQLNTFRDDFEAASKTDSEIEEVYNNVKMRLNRQHLSGKSRASYANLCKHYEDIICLIASLAANNRKIKAMLRVRKSILNKSAIELITNYAGKTRRLKIQHLTRDPFLSKNFFFELVASRISENRIYNLIIMFIQENLLIEFLTVKKFKAAESRKLAKVIIPNFYQLCFEKMSAEEFDENYKAILASADNKYFSDACLKEYTRIISTDTIPRNVSELEDKYKNLLIAIKYDFLSKEEIKPSLTTVFIMLMFKHGVENVANLEIFNSVKAMLTDKYNIVLNNDTDFIKFMFSDAKYYKRGWFKSLVLSNGNKVFQDNNHYLTMLLRYMKLPCTLNDKCFFTDLEAKISQIAGAGSRVALSAFNHLTIHFNKRSAYCCEGIVQIFETKERIFGRLIGNILSQQQILLLLELCSNRFLSVARDRYFIVRIIKLASVSQKLTEIIKHKESESLDVYMARVIVIINRLQTICDKSRVSISTDVLSVLMSSLEKIYDKFEPTRTQIDAVNTAIKGKIPRDMEDKVMDYIFFRSCYRVSEYSSDHEMAPLRKRARP